MKYINNVDVLIVCGKICSGKDTFCNMIAGEYEQIIVSDIVRGFIGAKNRSELSKTAELDKCIARKIIQEIRRYQDYVPYIPVVINGIRQPSIWKAILKECAHKEYSYKSIWIEVDDKDLKIRYEKRAARKDDTTFEEAIARDAQLGLAELEILIKKDPNSTIINH